MAPVAALLRAVSRPLIPVSIPKPATPLLTIGVRPTPAAPVNPDVRDCCKLPPIAPVCAALIIPVPRACAPIPAPIPREVPRVSAKPPTPPVATPRATLIRKSMKGSAPAFLSHWTTGPTGTPSLNSPAPMFLPSPISPPLTETLLAAAQSLNSWESLGVVKFSPVCADAASYRLPVNPKDLTRSGLLKYSFR